MRALRPILIGSLLSALLVGAVAPSAGADPVTDDAVAWIHTQQLEDGGFVFDEFDTPDALLAVAADAQTTADWDPDAARVAVDALPFDALKWLDDFAESGVSPELAAKLILLSALSLGDDPTAYDPEGDGSAVDLTASLDDIDPGLFNSFLFGRLAESALDENVHQADLQIVCEAQKAVGGGWSFDADPAGPNGADMDTTGFAVMALVSAGVDPTDPVLDAAEAFVLDGQITQADADSDDPDVLSTEDVGSWLSFGSPDPNTTALGMLGVTALGIALDDLPADPVAWLQSQQVTTVGADHGRFLSPNDGFGLNTFATSQAVQALLLAQDPGADWLPLAPTSPDARRCLPESTYNDVPATAWYDDGARWVDDADIVAGINGDLRPGANVNRAQAATWLDEVFGGNGGSPHSFTDVPPGAWYEDGVNFVGDAPNGPIAGGFGSQFRPRLKLNRAQAVSWLYAAAGSPDVTGLPAHGFSDVGPGAWFGDAVTWGKANGILSGFGDGTFRGNGNVSRAHLTQWLFNLVATPEAWQPGDPTLPPTILFSLFPP